MCISTDFQNLQDSLTNKTIRFGINELSLSKFSDAKFTNNTCLISEKQSITFHPQGKRMFLYIFDSVNTTLEEVDYIDSDNGLTQIQTAQNNLIIISAN